MSFSGCPCGWKTYEGACYKFDTSSKKSWDDARSACLAMSSDLVSIGSAKEQAFIASETRKYRTPFWIGFNDKRVEGKFEWSDGSPINYTYWKGGEPNNSSGNEDCADIAGRRAKWSDACCRGSSFYFICKGRLGKEILCAIAMSASSSYCIPEENVSEANVIHLALWASSSSSCVLRIL